MIVDDGGTRWIMAIMDGYVGYVDDGGSWLVDDGG